MSEPMCGEDKLKRFVFSSPGTKCHGEVLGWSSVRRRVSCVVRRQQLHKHLLLRNYWAESYETSPEASLGEEKQTIQNGILIPSLFWFPWQPKEKS